MATVIETLSYFELRRMFDPDFTNGAKVEWNEGQHVCQGTIVCEDRYDLGHNPFGHYTIRVHMEPISNYHHACHTAREMNSQTVSRSIDLHKLRLASS